MLKRSLMVCSFSIMLSACMPGSQQVGNVMSAVSRFEEGSRSHLAETSWSLHFGSYSSDVDPLQVNGSLIFRNSIGDVVEIENANVKVVRDLGRFDYLWQIQTSGNSKMYYVQGELNMTLECEPWRIEEAETLDDVPLPTWEDTAMPLEVPSVAIMYTQVCQATGRDTRVVNKYGYRRNMDMVFIQSAIGADQPYLILIKKS